MITSRTIRYKTSEDLRVLQHLVGCRSERALIQVFCGVIRHDFIKDLQLQLHKFFPGVAICGVTSAAEIIGSEACSDEVIINLTVFEKSSVKTVMVRHDSDPQKTVDLLVSAFNLPDLKSLIVFSSSFRDRQLTNGEPFITALGRSFKQALVCGGLAGEDNETQQTFVFDAQHIEEDGVVCTALEGSCLKVENYYNFGWVPIGKKLTITQNDGGRVYTIDNQPPKQIYARYLGHEVADNLPMSAIDFPLMIEREGIKMAAYMASVNADGSASFIHHFAPEEEVQFGFCHAGLIAEENEQLYQRISAFAPQALFVYSCISRKWLFGPDIGIDLQAWGSFPAAAGFFGYGEIYHPSGKLPHLFSQCLTLLALVEDPDARGETHVSDPAKLAERTAAETRRFRTLRVLHHLVQTTTREIEEMNEEFQRLAQYDFLTGLGNRRHFNEVLEVEFMRHKRSHLPLSILLGDIDYFKAFNDCYGHIPGDECLAAVARSFKAVLRRDIDSAARYGGEEFGFILPLTDYDDALAMAEGLRQAVMALNIAHAESHVADVVTLSIGVLTVDVDEGAGLQCSDLLELCDKNLYVAKEQGRNRVIGGRLSKRSDITQS